MALLFSLSACRPKKTAAGGDDGKGSGTVDNGGKINIPQDKWPGALLPSDMPEYKKGKLNGHNSGGNEIMIVISETNEEDLDAYIKDLEKAGYVKKSGRYCKGLYEIDYQFNSDTVLQISVYKEQEQKWPKELLGDVPALQKGNLVSIIEPSEETGNYGDMYFINLTEDDIKEWEKSLEAKGFEVSDKSYSKKDVKYMGKSYSALEIYFESNGDDEWNLYFGYEE
jgi:predicted lactoylglutathione lyase